MTDGQPFVHGWPNKKMQQKCQVKVRSGVSLYHWQSTHLLCVKTDNWRPYHITSSTLKTILFLLLHHDCASEYRDNGATVIDLSLSECKDDITYMGALQGMQDGYSSAWTPELDAGG
jgi:hypothetical protein